jgi:hypothetical protein
MDFVFLISGQSQVILVDTDGLLVSVEEVQIFCFEFIGDLEMASSYSKTSFLVQNKFITED